MTPKLSVEEENKLLEIIRSGEPFIIIAGAAMGHTYFPHTQSWRETLGLIEVMREVAKGMYKMQNKQFWKENAKERKKARKEAKKASDAETS